MDTDLIQGSDAWRLARVGSLGASQVAEALARTKTGWGAGRANVMAAMIAERLTGVPAETYKSAAMDWGSEKEPDARAAYAFYRDAEVASVGLVRHPTIDGTHASPDGLVGDDGLVEIKAPLTATHIDTLLGQSVPGKYVTQMQWQMACTDRVWCDFVSYDPRLPESMSLFIRRVHRDDGAIADLEREVIAFLQELEAKLSQLRAAYEQDRAA